MTPVTIVVSQTIFYQEVYRTSPRRLLTDRHPTTSKIVFLPKPGKQLCHPEAPVDGPPPDYPSLKELADYLMDDAWTGRGQPLWHHRTRPYVANVERTGRGA